MSFEEEDACVSYGEKDTLVSCEQENTCVSYEEEDTCLGSESLMISMNLELPVCEREVRVFSRYCLVYL